MIASGSNEENCDPRLGASADMAIVLVAKNVDARIAVAIAVKIAIFPSQSCLMDLAALLAAATCVMKAVLPANSPTVCALTFFT